jgi:hypothetical protein
MKPTIRQLFELPFWIAYAAWNIILDWWDGGLDDKGDE